MDTENQAGSKGLALAAGKGLAVIVMEPLLGGGWPIRRRRSAQVDGRGPSMRRSPADWALQWLWDQPEVSVVLSGMSTMDQVEAESGFRRQAQPRSFTARRTCELIEQLRRQYQRTDGHSLHRCGYCMPCPNGVNIPNIFDFYNYALSLRRYSRRPLQVPDTVHPGAAGRVLPRLQELAKSNARKRSPSASGCPRSPRCLGRRNNSATVRTFPG